MELHKQIEWILIEEKKPILVSELCEIINKKHNTNKEINAQEIQRITRQYSKTFHNINGLIFLAKDGKWNRLLSNVWNIANTLRGINNASETQFIIVGILFFRRIIDLNKSDKYIPIQILKFTASGKLHDPLFEIDEQLSELKRIDYQLHHKLDIFSDVVRLLDRLSLRTKYEIFEIAAKIDTSSYSYEEFGKIFEYFLQINSLEAYKVFFNSTPNSLKELMVRLLAPQFHKSLYNPFLGTGGLLVEALNFVKGDIKAVASEINPRAAQFAYMNLMMHGHYHFSLELEDSFTNKQNEEKYDFVIADLPINGITNSYSYEELFLGWGIAPPKKGKGFSGVILLVLSKLSQIGKAVITVPESFLFKQGKESEIRKLLIREDVIESIISLPHGTLRPLTEAKASIIVLNKNKAKDYKNKIKFIQAKSLESNKKYLDLDIEEVLNIYNNNIKFTNENKSIQLVESGQLLEGFNLTADSYNYEFYFANKMYQEGTGRFLKDLVEFKTGISPEKTVLDNNGDLPLVRIENLSKDIININLNGNGLDIKINNSHLSPKSVIREEALLVARIGGNLKPTYFKPSSTLPGIVIHRSVYAFLQKAKGPIINFEYLYYQLHSSFVQDQIKKKSSGSVMPFISISGLEKILIPYMDIKSQEDFIATQKASLISTERAKVEERIKALGYKEEVTQKESDIVQILVHQLRPTLTNIDFHVNTIKRIIEKYDLHHFKEYNDGDLNYDDPDLLGLVNIPSNYSLGEVVQKLSSDTLQLNDALTNVNKVMSFKLDQNDFEETRLLNFFKNYIHLKKMDFSTEFEFEVKGENPLVEINKSAFKELIDQLLLNAQKHAFGNFKPTKSIKKIQFNIRANRERQVAIIDYQNNGKPYSLTTEDFISAFLKGQSSDGSGIGGNYIYRIIKAHKGDVTIKEGLSTGFAMTIEIPYKQNF